MRIRAALLVTAIAATIAAPLAANTHTVTAACHGSDRVVSLLVGDGSAGSNTMYADERGYVTYVDVPPDARSTLDDVDDMAPTIPGTGYEGGRLPLVGRQTTADAGRGNFWIYLEANGHAGLQTGGEHAVLGETGGKLFWPPDCPGAHASSGFDAVLF